MLGGSLLSPLIWCNSSRKHAEIQATQSGGEYNAEGECHVVASWFQMISTSLMERHEIYNPVPDPYHGIT